MMIGMGAIDSFYGDRKQAVFQSSNPTLFFQIPEMKVKMLTRTT